MLGNLDDGDVDNNDGGDIEPGKSVSLGEEGGSGGSAMQKVIKG